MKAVLYGRTSTPEQHLESQFIQLRELAAQRGFEISSTYSDSGISGSKERRPGLDQLLTDARRGKFSVVIVAAFDRLARNTRNFLTLIDEFESLNIQLISARESVDTSTPMGRMFVTVLGCIAEIERSNIRERIVQGMRRRRLEGYSVGRKPLEIDHTALVAERLAGMSLSDVARKYGCSRASVVRFVREASKARGSVAAMCVHDAAMERAA